MAAAYLQSRETVRVEAGSVIAGAETYCALLLCIITKSKRRLLLNI